MQTVRPTIMVVSASPDEADVVTKRHRQLIAEGIGNSLPEGWAVGYARAEDLHLRTFLARHARVLVLGIFCSNRSEEVVEVHGHVLDAWNRMAIRGLPPFLVVFHGASISDAAMDYLVENGVDYHHVDWGEGSFLSFLNRELTRLSAQRH